jgi:hypothetical protein
MSATNTVYFSKVGLHIPVIIDGRPIGWEVAGSTGVLRVEEHPVNGKILARLNELADRQKLGVRRIEAEEYESIKKNPPLSRSNPIFTEPQIRPLQSPVPNRRKPSLNPERFTAEAATAVAKQPESRSEPVQERLATAAERKKAAAIVEPRMAPLPDRAPKLAV